MPVDFERFLRAVRRNRAGLKAYLLLARRGRATLADISRETRVRPDRVRAALRGKKGVYKREHSLRGLDVAKPAARGRVEVWEITQDGSAALPLLKRRLHDDPYVRELVDVAPLDDEAPVEPAPSTERAPPR